MCVRIFPATAFAALLFTLAPVAQAQEAAEPVATLQANFSSEVISEGKVSYYGRRHAGRRTASGERFDPHAFTMAHRTLPFGTLVRVTNRRNNQRVIVRVNDRGPVSRKRVGDLTLAAASKIGMIRSGVVDVLLETLPEVLAGQDGKP